MVINCVAYADGRKVGPVELDDISEVIVLPGHFVWIGLREPDGALMAKMQEEFGLHELAVEDALRAHQRPKVEDYGDSLFVVLRTAQMIDGELAFGETHIFLGESYLVSLRHGASLSYTTVRQRCEASPDLLRKGPGFVLYAIMDFVVDHYFPIVDAMEEELGDIEEAIFGDGLDRDCTQRVYQLKRQLVAIKRALTPLIEVCTRILRFDHTLVHADVHPYFRDVYDHVVRINERIDSTRELLSTALEANLSLISIRQNDVTKKLAGWAAILAVPTMIAGIYGMNFEHMPELQWKLGYPAVMLGMVALCGYVYYRFRRSDWL